MGTPVRQAGHWPFDHTIHDRLILLRAWMLGGGLPLDVEMAFEDRGRDRGGTTAGGCNREAARNDHDRPHDGASSVDPEAREMKGSV